MKWVLPVQPSEEYLLSCGFFISVQNSPEPALQKLTRPVLPVQPSEEYLLSCGFSISVQNSPDPALRKLRRPVHPAQPVVTSTNYNEAQEPCKDSQKYQEDDQISWKKGHSTVITCHSTESPSSSSLSWHTLAKNNLKRFWKIAQNSEWKTIGTKKTRTDWRHEKTEYFTWSPSLGVGYSTLLLYVWVLCTHTPS